MADRRPVCKRWVFVDLMFRGGRSGAKVQNRENPVAQKERTHEKERELPTFRPAEEPQEPVLPPNTRHCALIHQLFFPSNTSLAKALRPSRPSAPHASAADVRVQGRISVVKPTVCTRLS